MKNRMEQDDALFLASHRLMMEGLIDDAGMFRAGGVGVFAGSFPDTKSS